MHDDVVYNQILSFSQDSVDCHTVVKSYAEEGKLILVMEDAEKLLIDGRNVDTTGHKKRVQELLVIARKNGYEIDSKMVTHYAASNMEDVTVEYLLIKW